MITLQAQDYPNQGYANQGYANPGYSNRQIQRPDDGYIYPADGSSDQQVYPSPRQDRRLFGAQVYQAPQPQPRYNNQGYVQAPPGYYAQPRQQYYQPRGGYSQD